jgi:hypothetical protein
MKLATTVFDLRKSGMLMSQKKGVAFSLSGREKSVDQPRHLTQHCLHRKAQTKVDAAKVLQTIDMFLI